MLETKSSVTSAEVSQDGRYITTADGNSVKFWDANHFGLVKSYDMPSTVESASLEPTYGNKFITGGEDMWVHVYDFHTGEELASSAEMAIYLMLGLLRKQTEMRNAVKLRKLGEPHGETLFGKTENADYDKDQTGLKIPEINQEMVEPEEAFVNLYPATEAYVNLYP